MNQFFSFERFRLQVLKHWADNQKRYMLALLASTGLLFAWFVLNFFWLQDDVLQKNGEAVERGITVHGDLARFWAKQPGNVSQKTGLACSVLSQQSVNISLSELQAQAIEHRFLFIGKGKVLNIDHNVWFSVLPN